MKRMLMKMRESCRSLMINAAMRSQMPTIKTSPFTIYNKAGYVLEYVLFDHHSQWPYKGLIYALPFAVDVSC
jgi:hypothetical protein